MTVVGGPAVQQVFAPVVTDIASRMHDGGVVAVIDLSAYAVIQENGKVEIPVVEIIGKSTENFRKG